MLRYAVTASAAFSYSAAYQHMSETPPKRHGQDRNGTIAWLLEREQRPPVPLLPLQE